jgi:hypothetical protein
MSIAARTHFTLGASPLPLSSLSVPVVAESHPDAPVAQPVEALLHQPRTLQPAPTPIGCTTCRGRCVDAPWPRNSTTCSLGTSGNFSTHPPDRLVTMPKSEQAIQRVATPGIEPEPRDPAGHGPLWTAKDVAGYLQASPSWVYQKSEAGLLPCLPPLPGSNFLRFDPAAIKAYARGEWRPAAASPLRSKRLRQG